MFWHTFLFVLPLIGGPSGLYWEEYGKAKVWYNDSVFDEAFNSVQQILELNSNTTGLIPDKYRTIPIDGIINVRDILSW
jgi:hypothetical protein